MDEQKSPGTPLVELIELVLHETASDEQKRELQARLLDNAEDRKAYLHHLNLHSGLRRQFAFDGEEEEPAQRDPAGGEQVSATRVANSRLVSWSWTVVAAAAVVVMTVLYFQRPNDERPIAKVTQPTANVSLPIARITGLSGSLQWTGDGGRVLDDLSVGTELLGGTVEGMTPRSWFELEFNDGSTVTISGNSMLTFSDQGQKKLHLKEGNVSANVEPQPAGKPMLIYTRSAMLEVVGTQFEVQAGLAATMLNVSVGEVLIKRLSDNETVNVLAKHRVIAAADRELLPVPVPDSVSQWRSQLHLGPDGTQGKWSPETDAEDARLRAIPYTIPRSITIYTAGFTVSPGDKPPVMLQPGSRLRVRGRIASTNEVYFGVTVRRSNGEFAGRFQTVRPAVEFQGGQDFELDLQLDNYLLDSSLAKMKYKLPSDPFDLLVDTFWCHTLDNPAGLEIAEIELLSPMTSVSPQPAATQPATMDIWTAASQGNLKAVRHHLDAGTDVDAPVNAPGTAASGATPLHLAILADQRHVAEFLIEKGANLGARAQDEHGGTPLHWAAALGRIEMVKQLLSAGADINAPDNHGYTPLDATAYAPDYEREAKVEIADYLREMGGLTVEEKRTKPGSP